MVYDEANKLVKQAIGANIRTLRTASGQSQAKFAEMIGVNRSYVNQIECGKMNVSVGILVKIADGLDVPLTELFVGLESCAPHSLADGNAYSLIDFPSSK